LQKDLPDILAKALAEGSISSIEESISSIKEALLAEGSVSWSNSARELALQFASSSVGYAHQLSLKFAEQTSKDYFYLLHDKDEFETLKSRNGCRPIKVYLRDYRDYLRDSSVIWKWNSKFGYTLPTVTSLEFAGKHRIGLPEDSICVSEKTLRMCYFKEEVRARNFPGYHGVNYLSTITISLVNAYPGLKIMSPSVPNSLSFQRDFEAFIKVTEVNPETFKINGESDEPFKWIIPKEQFKDHISLRMFTESGFHA
jgi:hypothetical protein